LPACHFQLLNSLQTSRDCPFASWSGPFCSFLLKIAHSRTANSRTPTELSQLRQRLSDNRLSTQRELSTHTQSKRHSSARHRIAFSNLSSERWHLVTIIRPLSPPSQTQLCLSFLLRHTYTLSCGILSSTTHGFRFSFLSRITRRSRCKQLPPRLRSRDKGSSRTTALQ